MKTAVVLAFLLSVTGTTAAQMSFAQTSFAQSQLPITIPIKTPQGEIIGTATTNPNDNVIVFRDAKGELTGSARVTKDAITYYDVHGKITHSATMRDNELVVQDADGKVIGKAQK